MKLNSALRPRLSSVFFCVAIAIGLQAIIPTISTAAPSPGATCDFGFEARGTDIQVLIGYSKLRGAGQITCVDNVTSKVEVLPFKITIGTPLLFPRISFAPSLIVRGGANGVKILKGGAHMLLDEYLTIDTRGAIGSAGFATFLTLDGQKNGLSMDLGLDAINGFGIAVGGTIVTLE